ncbi:MAG: dockerin type I repeat-containing protein [Planctomycetota bacterium]|nr:dockerin type I repeat-containing protein [Planctomycetota bacterium]
MKYFITATSLLILTLMFPLAIQAQNTPFPPTNPSELGFSCADVSVQPGEIFELVFMLDNPNPVSDWFMLANSPSASDCQFLTMNTGAAIGAYEAANGNIPVGQCDVEAVETEVAALMFFPTPFSSSMYGNEIYRLSCVAGMTPKEVAIPFIFSGNTGTTQGQVVITISDPSAPADPGMMRGDVNLDNSCNLTDAINLLDYLYVGNYEATCADSCDVDDSGSVNLADAVNLLSGLFGGGFLLEDTCKPDATPDPLAECLESTCP